MPAPPKGSAVRYIVAAIAAAAVLIILLMSVSDSGSGSRGPAASAAVAPATDKVDYSSRGGDEMGVAPYDAVTEGEPAGTRPNLFSMPRTPAFPIKVSSGGGAGLIRGEMIVPLYIIVMNKFEDAFSLAKEAAKVDVQAIRNKTHDVRVRVRTVIIDNTNCHRPLRLTRDDKYFFESHAEYARIDCREWAGVKRLMKKDFGTDVVVPPVGLTFGPAMNLIQRDATERLQVPRVIWAHSDAAVKDASAIERLAVTTALLRSPFCAFFTQYDVMLAFDVFSLMRQVGDWDQYLWYYNDVDYFARCRHAQLPYGELAISGDVVHVGGGAQTLMTLSQKAHLRFSTQAETFRIYRALRVLNLNLDRIDLPGKSTLQVKVTFSDMGGARQAHEVAMAVSKAVGHWMYPWRYTITPPHKAQALQRLPVLFDLIPVDRQNRDVPGEAVRQAIIAALGCSDVSFHVSAA